MSREASGKIKSSKKRSGRRRLSVYGQTGLEICSQELGSELPQVTIS